MKSGIHITPSMVFVLNSLLVFTIILLAIRFLNRRNPSQFRDDLWAKAKAKANNPDHVRKTVDFLALEQPEPDSVSSSRAKSQHPYQPPNFNGRPHEILGIPQEANEETIQSAYKYWVKRFHPDSVAQLGPSYIAQANRRTEQLNEARAILLKRFK